MAIEYFDGFDDFTTAQITRYWTGNSGATIGATGRNGGGGLTQTNNAHYTSKSLANQATRSVGFAFLLNSSGSGGTFFQFLDGSTVQLTFKVNSVSRLIEVYRGISTLLGTTSIGFTQGVWVHVEIVATIHPSAGVVTVNVNGTQALNLTSQNTRNSANSYSNVVGFGSPDLANNGSGNFTVDDFWSDNAGTAHGDCRVETKLTTGNGATNNFTPSTGSNYQNVDEATSNDDTDYNYSAVAGDIDLFTFPVLATTAGGVKAVMPVPVLRNDAAGTVTIQTAIRSGGTNYFGSSQNVGSTTYGAYPEISAVDPDTSSAWTVAGVNAAQFGIKRTV